MSVVRDEPRHSSSTGHKPSMQATPDKRRGRSRAFGGRMNREVRKTGKDRDGDILRLCGPWGVGGTVETVLKNDAIRHIELRTHTYFVRAPNGGTVAVRVVNGPTGKYLRTQKDSSGRDNLDNLPEC